MNNDVLKDRGEIIAEGKTKVLYKTDTPGVSLVESKKTITALDNPDLTKEFESKAIDATTTTCRTFELLKAAGVPVAYIKQVSKTEFLAAHCRMIPLEVVARRYAVGSFLKRFPNIAASSPPQRFHHLVVEFFLKTTKGMVTYLDSTVKNLGLKADLGQEDPLILNPYDNNWKLWHSKHPIWTEDEINLAIDALCVPNQMTTMDRLVRQVFLVLEGAWSQFGYRLIDLKIEFGLTPAGELVVADVIDNDSWRLKNNDWKELSKQVFRDGGLTREVESNYQFVARMSKRLSIPTQALVIWTASKDDAFLTDQTPPIIPGVVVERVVLSGHKEPTKTLNKLRELEGNYPEGGVIITKVGMSNGLGPILAARSNWPVIAVPANANEHPEDIASSTRMPSKVPLATILNDKNALASALNILSLKNPAAYAFRRLEIEENDRA